MTAAGPRPPEQSRTVPHPAPKASGSPRRGDKRGRGRGRGALVLIAGLLGASALIRIGLGVTDAMALEPQVPSVSAAPEPISDVGAMALLAAIRAREDRLSQAEAAFADRNQALALAEHTIDTKLAALISAEAALSATIARAETASEGDLAKLTSVYENMKSADAAALFEEMAPEFAAGFLGRMRPEVAAGVMAGLKPQTAYSISVLLAGRNARTPTE